MRLGESDSLEFGALPPGCCTQFRHENMSFRGYCSLAASHGIHGLICAQWCLLSATDEAISVVLSKILPTL